MTAKQPNILIFDSGVGGLSIAEHVRDMLPFAAIDYVADNALFPYGLLQDSRLIERVCLIINQAISSNKPDIIVIACNSASTLVLPTLREKLGIPVVGVVPAIKPAAKISKSKVIGLLATPGTILRDYTDELIGEFARDCEIIKVGSSELVQLVEQKVAGTPPTQNNLEEVLRPLTNHPRWQNMDTIVLACTHFPLIKQELAITAPNIKYWVDSGEAIARRVKSLLDEQGKDAPEIQLSKAQFSDLNTLNSHQRAFLSSLGFTELQQL
jgi:glutamate racemase